MNRRVLARCHQKGGQGVAIGALIALAYHFAACMYIALSGASERVFTSFPTLEGLDAALASHIRAAYLRLTGGGPPVESSDLWGVRLTAIFASWLVLTIALALVGGAVGVAWACRPGHKHRKRTSH